MEGGKLKLAVFGNVYQTERRESIRTFFAAAAGMGCRVAVDSMFCDYVRRELDLAVEPDEVFGDDDFAADFAVSLGGDGTFLATAARVGVKEIPIIGINTGHLGFLADISSDDIAEAVRSLLHGNYCIERRSTLRVTAESAEDIKYPFALNEVAILKHDNSSMISIDTFIDDHFLATYKADGLIVATPTGSTGYSLSVGGPIIFPTSNSIVLTPIAAHSLNVRPFVLDDRNTVRLTVRSRNHSFLASLDGRSRSFSDCVGLKVRKAPHSVFVVKRNDTIFFDTLRNKLMWGADGRI